MAAITNILHHILLALTYLLTKSASNTCNSNKNLQRNIFIPNKLTLRQTSSTIFISNTPKIKINDWQSDGLQNNPVKWLNDRLSQRRMWNGRTVYMTVVMYVLIWVVCIYGFVIAIMSYSTSLTSKEWGKNKKLIVYPTNIFMGQLLHQIKSDY